MPIRSLSPGTDKWSGRTGCNIQVRITGVATYTEKKRKSTERTEDVANVKQGKTGAMRHASRLFAPAIRSTWRQAPCSLHLWDFITIPLLCFRIKMSQIFVTCTQRWFPKTWKRLRGFFFSSVLPFYPFLLKPFFQLYQKYSQSVFQLTPVRAWPEWALTVSSSENTVSVLDDCSLAILELAFSSQPRLPSLIHSNKSTTLHDRDLIKTMMDGKKINRDRDTIHSPRWLKKNKH